MHHKINSNNSRHSQLWTPKRIYIFQKCILLLAYSASLNIHNFIIFFYIVSLICIFESKSIYAGFELEGICEESGIKKYAENGVACGAASTFAFWGSCEEVLVERIYAGI